jgi:enoyl-CoA hydratase/carnithine racemase
MEFILTGDSASGTEFERLGIVNKVFPKQEVLTESMKLAERISNMSAPVINAAKQAVLTGKSADWPNLLVKKNINCEQLKTRIWILV